MADLKTGGVGTVVGAILGVGAMLLMPVDDAKKPLDTATVSEMVSTKADSSTKEYLAADVIREAGKDISYEIAPAKIDEETGKVLVPAETLKTIEVDVPRSVQRPEATLPPVALVEGDTLRVVVYRGEKAVAVWAQQMTEPAGKDNELRAYVQVNIRDQVVR
jgi:hypothetical protein